MKRANAFETERRVAEVRDLLLEGAARADIHAVMAEKYDLTGRQADNYVRRARADLMRDLETLGLSTAAWHVGARRRLFRQAVAKNDLRTALAVVRDMADIQGLYGRTAGEDLFDVPVPADLLPEEARA